MRDKMSDKMSKTRNEVGEIVEDVRWLPYEGREWVWWLLIGVCSVVLVGLTVWGLMK